MSRILATLLLPLYTHYLPPGVVRSRRDHHRGDGGARDRAADGDLERVLPLLLRREGARGEADGDPNVVLVHDGDVDGRARARRRLRLADRALARPRRTTPALVRAGAVGLWAQTNYPAADGAFPRRGALDAVRDRERCERADHGRRDGVVRRRLPLGRDRARRRQLHRHARRLRVLLAYRSEQLGLEFDRGLLRKMQHFGMPLVPSALALWTINFVDREFIVHYKDAPRSASTPRR